MASDDEWDWDDEPKVLESPKTNISHEDNDISISEERVAETVQQLWEFQQNLADPAFLNEINRQLSAIKFQNFIKYYESKSDLSKYTIETELSVRDLCLHIKVLLS